MKETSFINQNKKKWARFEKLRNNKTNDPDEVSELFTEITEDLSYARTFYPRRSVRVYLNQLAQGVFTSLYKQRRQPLGSFKKFWTKSVPLEVYRSRFNLLTAFLFFMVAVLIGVVSQHYDVDFVRIVLGDGYVNSTEGRIANGNPMGVYGEMNKTSMFLYITMNNIRVSLLVFVTGILFNIVTYFLLIKNGIMLGCFQWWFKAKGLLLTSFLAVWIHGAFEISAIIIAGGAGLTVGNGLFFPGSFSRIQSLIFAAKRGLIIMMSLVPFFIVAGFFESFVTRYYREIPDPLKWCIILSSFAIIFLYFGVYPFIAARKKPDLIFAVLFPPYFLLRLYMKNRTTEDKIEIKEIPRFIPDRKLILHQIRSIGEIFTDTFYLFVNEFNSVFKNIIKYTLLPLAILVTVITYFDFNRLNSIRLTWWESFGTYFGTGSDFEAYKIVIWPLIFAMIITQSIYGNYRKVLKYQTVQLVLPFLSIYVLTTVVFSIFLFASGQLLFFCFFITPFVALLPPIIIIERKNFFSAWGRSFQLIKKSYGDGLGSVGAFTLIAVIFFWILTNPFNFGITSLAEEIVKMVTITTVEDYAVVIAVVNMILYLIYIIIILSIFSIAFGLLYFNGKEKDSATGLYERLNAFGERSRTHEKKLDFE